MNNKKNNYIYQSNWKYFQSLICENMDHLVLTLDKYDTITFDITTSILHCYKHSLDVD